MDIRALATGMTHPTRHAAPPRSQAADSVTLSSAEQTLRDIEKTLRFPCTRGEEARVLATLRSLPADDLNHVLAHLDLGRLMDKLEDHLAGPKHHQEALALLARDRLADVSVANRVRLVDALQHGRTDSAEERAIADIFTGTAAADLGALKDGIDAGGDHHDLQQLIFHDIDDASVKNRILAHLKSAPAGPPRLMSDIDDTFYANWTDDRFPKKTVYPGVRAFYRELSNGHLAFVTARPDERTGTVKDRTLASLRARGVDDAVVLAGRITHFVGNDRIAQMKYRNFENYRAMHPESPFLFVGDSGQGDVAFGQEMRFTPDGNVPAVFIHDVVNTPQAVRDQYRDQEVYFFDTYAGAALEAYRKGFLTRDAMLRIAREAQQDFAAIPFADPAQQAARQADLTRDLAAVAAEP